MSTIGALGCDRLAVIYALGAYAADGYALSAYARGTYPAIGAMAGYVAVMLWVGCFGGIVAVNKLNIKYSTVFFRNLNSLRYVLCV
jgi:hypothetical protein